MDPASSLIVAARVELARRCLHDLNGREDDEGVWVDPFDDPEIRREIRRTFAELKEHGRLYSTTAPTSENSETPT